jgi:hypothetical protein
LPLPVCKAIPKAGNMLWCGRNPFAGAALNMRTLILSMMLLTLTAGSAPAGNLIHKACMKADRANASRELCKCIQEVADIRLKRKEQKLAAGFFKDPHKAQEIRQSDNHNHEAFWTRYKAFGIAAEDRCTS